MAVELYRHNAYAYEQIEEKLKTSNRTCVIHPTGSGNKFFQNYCILSINSVYYLSRCA